MASSLQSWELENAIELVDPSRDSVYATSNTEKALDDAKPWRADPNFFKSVRISAIALLKMTMHARSGGAYEIMGLMTGYATHAGEFVVTDAFRLPVEGTETRVNAQEEAYEYMVQYTSRSREVGIPDNAIGWYHSHPGYGCWLSGIDVNTQMNQQAFQDPWVAVVIDPHRTISAGKVEIGAFRTYPEGHTASGDKDADDDGFQSIPVNKMEDFGAYSDRYYALEVSHFKSTLDTTLLEALWHKYWIGTLASSPLFTNRNYGTKQMLDLAQKIRMADSAAGGTHPHTASSALPPVSASAAAVSSSTGAASAQELVAGSQQAGGRGDRASAKVRLRQLEKIVQAGNKISAEEKAGLMAADIKEKLFSGVGLGLDGTARIA